MCNTNNVTFITFVTLRKKSSTSSPQFKKIYSSCFVPDKKEQWKIINYRFFKLDIIKNKMFITSAVFTNANENYRRKNTLSRSTTLEIWQKRLEMRLPLEKKVTNIPQRCSVKSRVDDDVVKERTEWLQILYRDVRSLVVLMTQHGRTYRRKSKVRPVL